MRPQLSAQPHVTVKRSRVAAAKHVTRPVLAQTPVEPSCEDKSPRVFRLGSIPVEGMPAPALPEKATPDLAPRRLRRVDLQKRPGPVVVAFQAPTPPPQAVGADGCLSRAEVHALHKMLARLEPVLEDIRRAQKFWFFEATQQHAR